MVLLLSDMKSCVIDSSTTTCFIGCICFEAKCPQNVCQMEHVLLSQFELNVTYVSEWRYIIFLFVFVFFFRHDLDIPSK